MFFFVVLVLNYFHKQTLFRSASILTAIRKKHARLPVKNHKRRKWYHGGYGHPTLQKIMSSKLPVHWSDV